MNLNALKGNVLQHLGTILVTIFFYSNIEK